MKILLTNYDWFLLGAFTILFLYFIIYFLTKRTEKYNLYFSIGCFLSILRILSMGSILSTDSSYVYALDEKLIHLHFIWSPFFYILLADSLFPAFKSKTFIRVFFGSNIFIERTYCICVVQSFSVSFVLRLCDTYYDGLCVIYIHRCPCQKISVFIASFYGQCGFHCRPYS